MLIASCSPQAAGPTATPTETATPFVFPTYAFNPPTEAPQIATAAAATAAARAAAAAAAAVALDPVAVERGKGRWEVLECGSCHGANGEGTDDGPALAGVELEEEAFINYLRTGGTLGNDHLYATNRLSEGGIRNLYQYILSLEPVE
jgi:mono/diheme cytochrome c family protein